MSRHTPSDGIGVWTQNGIAFSGYGASENIHTDYRGHLAPIAGREALICGLGGLRELPHPVRYR
jgi:hypothetical protein